ncbi:MAG: hypothetical protein ACR2OO_03095 [Thermomicrobiales bacterium]
MMIVPAIALATASGAGVSGVAAVAAQSATPEPRACSVAPRSDAEIAALQSTPPAATTRSVDAGMVLPEGASVDAATIAELESTLAQVTACTKAQDLPRLLALFSDGYVVSVMLAPEPVPIVPGTPIASPESLPNCAPVSGDGAKIAVLEARSLPDGRIAARVSDGGHGGAITIVLFTRQADLWRIDETHPEASPAASPTPSPAATPVVDLPQAIRDAVTAAAATALGVDPAAVVIVRAEAKEWPDSSLGCPKPGGFYAQVITPGRLVVVEAGGRRFAYHTDEVGNVTGC